MTKANIKPVQKKLSGYAEKALEAYAKSIGRNYHTGKENLTDILADLRHYADVCGLNFHEALDASYDHYLAEKKGGML